MSKVTNEQINDLKENYSREKVFFCWHNYEIIHPVHKSVNGAIVEVMTNVIIKKCKKCGKRK